jgi:hypothetical protein
VSIGISGWLSSPSDVNKPWEVLDAGATEPFALRFELDAMLRLGTSLNDVLFSYAWDGLTYTVVSRTLLGALYAGLWPLGLIKVASVLDNPFSVALARADKAGKVLAHALIDGVQGKRPVTLIGYSVGARVIYACLMELAEQHAFGLVESVVLMGAPAPSSNKQWRQIRAVVSARVVNVYSTEDYVLGYLYRSTKLEMGVAGLMPVQDIHGIENMDVSKLVSGHDQYRYLVGLILVKVGFGDLNFEKVADQQRALEVAEEKKQRIKEQAKRRENEATTSTARQPTLTPKPTITKAATPASLVDVDEPKQPHARPPRGPQPQGQRPAFYSQSRSKQQPAMAMTSRMERPKPEDSHVSLTPPATRSPTLDPLGSTKLIETAAPTVKNTTRPMASAATPRQTPSTLVSTAETDAQGSKIAKVPFSYGNEIRDGPITLIDSSDDLSKDVSGQDKPKTAAAVTVTEVLVAEHDGGNSLKHVESDDEAYDDLADEIGSDFGELTMVDPVPLDDFDYGLM